MIFRAFILIDKNLLEQQQSSFLNWFEKHYINYKNLLDRDFGKIYFDLFWLFENYNQEKFLFFIKQKEDIWEWIFNNLN